MAASGVPYPRCYTASTLPTPDNRPPQCWRLLRSRPVPSRSDRACAAAPAGQSHRHVGRTTLSARPENPGSAGSHRGRESGDDRFAQPEADGAAESDLPQRSGAPYRGQLEYSGCTWTRELPRRGHCVSVRLQARLSPCVACATALSGLVRDVRNVIPFQQLSLKSGTPLRTTAQFPRPRSVPFPERGSGSRQPCYDSQGLRLEHP